MNKEIEMTDRAWDKFNALLDEFGDQLGVITYLSYNGSVALDVYNVLRLSDNNDTNWFEKTAEILNLKDTHVELIKYILCAYDLAEYGSSPRGAWLTDKGKDFLDKLTKIIEGKDDPS